jgi:hypothetical protein
MAKPQDLDTMQKLWADSNIAKFSERLRTSPLYQEYIKPELESSQEYIRLRSEIINHPKTIQQLKSRREPQKGYYGRPRKICQNKSGRAIQDNV